MRDPGVLYLLQTVFTLGMVSVFFAAIVNEEKDIPRKSFKYTLTVCAAAAVLVGVSSIFS